MAKRFLIALALTLMLCSCGHKDPQLIPMSTPHVVELSPDDTVRMLLYAGFSDEDILKYGTGIRNGLAVHGGTQINDGEQVQATFAVIEPNKVHVCTMLKGNFLYDLRTHTAMYN